MASASSRPVALVTGASSGIGAELARRLAARGHDLILVARRAGRLARLADALHATHGATSRIVAADLGQEAGLAEVEAAMAAEPRLALLVNNAGLSRVGPAAQMPAADAAVQIALNVTALTRLSLAALPLFLARGEGAILNVASALALHGNPGAAVYSATKAYVLTFSRALQEELAGTGVRVQVVLPAAVATEIWEGAGLSLSQIPAELVMSVEDMAEATLAGFDRAEVVTLPSVEDASLWDAYEASRGALFAATQTGRAAGRYWAA